MAADLTPAQVLPNIKATQASLIAEMRTAKDWPTHEAHVNALLALDLAPYVKTMAAELEKAFAFWPRAWKNPEDNALGIVHFEWSYENHEAGASGLRNYKIESTNKYGFTSFEYRGMCFSDSVGFREALSDFLETTDFEESSTKYLDLQIATVAEIVHYALATAAQSKVFADLPKGDTVLFELTRHERSPIIACLWDNPVKTLKDKCSIPGLVCGFTFDEILPFTENLAAARRDNKWGFINAKGDTIVDFLYKEAKPFSEGLAAVQTEIKSKFGMQKRWGYIDHAGKVVIEPLFWDVKSFSEGFAAVSDGYAHYIDKTGRNTFGLKFDGDIFGYNEDPALSFENGFACVRKNKKYGHIDSTGKIVIPCEYESLSWVCNGLIAAQKEGKYGYINTRGEIIVPFIYNQACSFSEGLACVSVEDRKYGYIDVTGKLVLDYQFPNTGFFGQGRSRLLDEKKHTWGFINTAGKTVIPCTLSDFPDRFTDTLLAVPEENGKYGFIDINGQIVIPHTYAAAADFTEGLARVRKGSKWGFIDRENRMVVEPAFDSATDFQNGYAIVSRDDKYGFIARPAV